VIGFLDACAVIYRVEAVEPYETRMDGMLARRRNARLSRRGLP
jgi:hypothetical protein